jgi:hypothetical protein
MNTEPDTSQSDEGPIELHGWDDLHIHTRTMFALTSRAYKAYSYFLFRARDKGSAFPGITRMCEDLEKECPDETWSEPTGKRAIAECVLKEYFYRERRPNQTSITHVFRTPYDCHLWKERRQITNDPTVGSPVIRPSDHPRSDIKITKEKENKEKDHSVLDSPQAPQRGVGREVPKPPPKAKKGGIRTRGFSKNQSEEELEYGDEDPFYEDMTISNDDPLAVRVASVFGATKWPDKLHLNKWINFVALHNNRDARPHADWFVEKVCEFAKKNHWSFGKAINILALQTKYIEYVDKYYRSDDGASRKPAQTKGGSRGSNQFDPERYRMDRERFK